VAAQDSTRIPSAQPFFHALKTDGIRISPMFRVFCFRGGWRVCGTNLEGNPVSNHSKHSTLRAAFSEASRANQLYAGIKPMALKATARSIASLKRGE
jgi:hypothetical protein